MVGAATCHAGAVWRAAIEAGEWAGSGVVKVEIPATRGFEGGYWYRVRRDERGIFVPDERGAAACYMVCEPLSHYYQVMTRSVRMPRLIGERI